MMDKQPARHWSISSAFEQIEKCGYECEGGPLANNDAYVWLKEAHRVGPEFWPGQGVYFNVKATALGVDLCEWKHFYVVGCHMDSDSDKRFWTYDLSHDPPAPYHYGTLHAQRVSGALLRLEAGS